MFTKNLKMAHLLEDEEIKFKYMLIKESKLIISLGSTFLLECAYLDANVGIWNPKKLGNYLKLALNSIHLKLFLYDIDDVMKFDFDILDKIPSLDFDKSNHYFKSLC
jgi:hypothetical protein